MLCCNDIHILKENLEVAKRLFYFTGASEFNSLPIFIRSKKSFLDFSRETKDLFLNYLMNFLICFNCVYFFIYIYQPCAVFLVFLFNLFCLLFRIIRFVRDFTFSGRFLHYHRVDTPISLLKVFIISDNLYCTSCG